VETLYNSKIPGVYDSLQVSPGVCVSASALCTFWKARWENDAPFIQIIIDYISMTPLLFVNSPLLLLKPWDTFVIG